VSPSAFLRLAAHIHLMPVLESGEETLVGGQAVIEGVMMRAPHSYCVAVRRPDGEIVTEEMPVPRMSEKYPLFKYPILRGLGTLGQAMSLGIKALKFSANAALTEEEASKVKPQEVSSWMLSLNLIFSFGFFIFLYKFVPLKIAEYIGSVYSPLHSDFAININLKPRQPISRLWRVVVTRKDREPVRVVRQLTADLDARESRRRRNRFTNKADVRTVV